MAELTRDAKLAAARAALETLDPPVTEESIAERTVEIMVEVFWSQMALVPPPATTSPGPAAEMPALSLQRWARPKTPEQQQRAQKIEDDLSQLLREIDAA